MAHASIRVFTRFSAWIGSALLLGQAGAWAGTQPAASLSDQDKTCLTCHSQRGLAKDLPGGKSLALHVAGDDFALSVHGALGCAACHADIGPETHVASPAKIGSAREYSISRAQVCSSCHEDKSAQYSGSIHATLVRLGNERAPVCTDCHSPHSVRPKSVADAITGLSCRKCHEPIFNAYSQSMHGRARGKLGHVEAPICADCHSTHEVNPVSAGTRLKDACLACHANASEAHRAWLPNAGRHLQSVSCVACHAPTAQRRVDLRLYDAATGERVSDGNGSKAKLAGGGLDASALWNLLRDTSAEERGTRLQGRLEVRTGVEAHRLEDKSRAVRDCQSCHSDGADPFQTVTVSVIGPDGRPLRFAADKQVLNGVDSVRSVGGFYAIGGTRVKLLDALLGLVFVAAASVPVAHQGIRWLIRRRDRDARRRAGAAAADDRAASANADPER